MAIMIPSYPYGYSPESREDDIFFGLEKLPNDYFVFHSFKFNAMKGSTWKEKEIDFLISEGSKISGKLNAIEVKSSKNYTTTSLSAFLNRYGRKRIKNAYVIHPKSYQEANGIIYLPAYMSFCL